MTTTSHNERTALTRRVMKGKDMTTQHKHRARKMREVGTPSNPMAFLRDGARYGAIRITDKAGTTRYYLGAPTHYYDADRGVYLAPLFAPTSARLSRQFVASVEMGQLD